MTNNEPKIKTTIGLPAQLCFFYNFRTRTISFSSSSPDAFFETTPGQSQHPPFLAAVERADVGFLMNEWDSCFQLKEKESRNFTVVAAQRNRPLSFSFTVTRPVSCLVTDPSLLIVCATKTALSSAPPQKKTPSPSTEEYTEFIELAAHDLDSPLRKLSILVDRIAGKKETQADMDTQTYILRARSCLAEMRSLIENLSLLGRLGGSAPKQIPCNLENIIQMARNDLENFEGVKEAKISIGPLPTVQGDQTQYRQLFKSLLENAFKFRKKEIPLELEISNKAVTDGEKQLHNLPLNILYCKIIISDKGIGFRQEYADKIFQPFVRLNGKSEYPGNGMGLAICKKIVENHCGIIDAESEENFGARFILFLPVSPD
ncbi:MAG: ATP-binding protein [Chitinophagaceae bacterium]